MARSRRSSGLESRDARRKLTKANEPYWVTIDGAVALGYRKGEKSGTWHARVRLNGAYRRDALGIADDFRDADGRQVLDYWQAQAAARSAAERLIREDDPKWQAAQVERATAGYTVREASEHYLAWYRFHRKAIRETETAIKAHILPRLGERPIQEIKARELREWLNRLAARAPRRRTRLGKAQAYGEKPDTEDAKRARRATANRVFGILKAILNRAFQDELVADDSAWRKVRPFKGADEPVIRFLAAAEATRLVNASPPPFRSLVAAALHTGARYSELTTLTAGDFSAKAAALYFRPSKSGRGRHVPLSAEGLEFFKRVTAGHPGNALIFTRGDGAIWGKNHQVRPLTEACKVAKIAPAITFHELRHTYASTLINEGVELPVISKLLGHADTRITMRHYAHLADKTLRAAVARLPSLGVSTDDKIRAVR
jgi:integrase